jgi:hypothetical protein
VACIAVRVLFLCSEDALSTTQLRQSDTDLLEAAADEAIAACGGDAREAVKALIVANHFLETELEKLRASFSTGCEAAAA